jgi:hypothetical protein
MRLIIANDGRLIHEVPNPTWHLVELAITSIGVGRSEVWLEESDESRLRISDVSGRLACVLRDRGHDLAPQETQRSRSGLAWVKVQNEVKVPCVSAEDALRVARWFWEHSSANRDWQDS